MFGSSNLFIRFLKKGYLGSLFFFEMGELDV